MLLELIKDSSTTSALLEIIEGISVQYNRSTGKIYSEQWKLK